MSANTNTDLTEEDAADLQFPKDEVMYSDERDSLKSEVHTSCEISTLSDQSKELRVANVENPPSEVKSQCANCVRELSYPFILCVSCDENICCECFAKGAEFSAHKNDHPYSVINDNFLLFANSDWTASEELKLLEGLQEHRNFHSVAKCFSNRTIKDLKEHYDKFYIGSERNKFFPKFPETNASLFPELIVPYRFNVNNNPDPPRHAPGTLGFNSLAGYNAARSDFEISYDTNAEDLVTNLETIRRSEPQCDILSDLQCAIANIYTRRLEERQRRRRIIREHGLIVLRKMTAWLHRYDQTITPPVYERLIHFMQFYTGEGFEYMMEGLHRAGELKLQIIRLCEFRKKGITTLAGARLYLNLKHQRDENLKALKVFHNNTQIKPKMKMMPMVVPVRKRTSMPLDVIGLPGYEKLQPRERDLCASVRLVPLTYLELKETLVAENNKLGYLKLLTARRILKIDVNKTRRLYDFLIEEGFICKPK